MTFELPALPYDRNALEPHLSAEALDYHYGRLHRSHVAALNTLVEGTALEGKSLEEILHASNGRTSAQAAEVWNHAFYWHCLAPKGGGEPTGALSDALTEAFGDLSTFKQVFLASAMDNDASGWTWLIKTPNAGIEILSTGHADTPIAHGRIPLLAIDVHEHAYALDYGDSRSRYLENLWQVINWDFIAQNFSSPDLL
ncbi:superoxide dismutase [Fe] [Halomonas sp. TRM85114]|uniref:Fe-Mn family superoxide dismutase n=1 Tax=Halomonas jincaotanensis TaxID=2810616 RepID=UPI001BD57A57|nr:Fe-Mn family superoxide dismutase [Halomonas jincaotanensis]MBS9402590.1 superoxide dismutase [Fe] [Halomonas jincaotanensis]